MKSIVGEHATGPELKKPISLSITPSHHSSLKRYAADIGQSMSSIFEESTRRELDHYQRVVDKASATVSRERAKMKKEMDDMVKTTKGHKICAKNVELYHGKDDGFNYLVEIGLGAMNCGFELYYEQGVPLIKHKERDEKQPCRTSEPLSPIKENAAIKDNTESFADFL